MLRWSRRLVSSFAILLASVAPAHADYVQVLHTFSGGPGDGANPAGRLVHATDGFLYGVTGRGGAFNGGTFFRMATDGTGFTVLHSFEAEAWPRWLIQARDGGFYGVQRFGVTSACIFRLASDGTKTSLYNCTDVGLGLEPLSIIEATDGNLYVLMGRGGIDEYGDPSDMGAGTVIRLTPAGEPSVVWQFRLFMAHAPIGYLIQSTDGTLYGMTAGASDPPRFGFRMVPDYDYWEFPALGIKSALEEGPDGALYGIVPSPSCGRIDRISVTDWSQTSIHAFDCNADLGGAVAAPVSGGDGFLYGTTANMFYRVNSSGTDYTLLAPLPGGPAGPLTRGSDGLWYGMTASTAFRLMPGDPPPPPPPAAGFDADAIAEMPLYDATTGTWRILMSGTGYVASRLIYLGGPEYTPVPADYDGDGRYDIAVYRAGNGFWYVLTSSSNFTDMVVKIVGGPAWSPVPGDFDRDRKADFAVYNAATGVWRLLKSSTGYTNTMQLTMAGAGGVPVRGDFDGDGFADAALYNPATGAWRILTSSSNFVTLITKTLGGPGYAPVTGDYDGDGKSDAAVYHGATGTWSVLQSSTDTTVTNGWGGTGYAPVPGDYDADGRTDLAVYAGGSWYVLQSSTGFSSVLYAQWGMPIESPVTTLPVRTTWTDALRASDFDGDGTSDIVVYEPSTGVWSILTSSSHFSETRTITWGGATWDIPVPGDYDGDGLTDAAIFNPATGVWSLQRSTRGPLIVTLGTWEDVPVPGDYDGDGTTEPAVFTPSTAAWQMRWSTLSSSFTTQRTVTYGAAWWTPMTGDYDGDGKTDLGLYDAYRGRWAAALGKSDYSTQLTMAWGGPTYVPMPADYDGDGKNEFAVCVKTTGNWYMVRSGFNYSTAFGLPWGEPIDTPRAGDYDGDGIADMASYDSTTGEWYVALSSSYFTLRLERTLGGAGFTVPR
jgi:uncharacterized repeat protein (TIGR03803 family)